MANKDIEKYEARKRKKEEKAAKIEEQVKKEENEKSLNEEVVTQDYDIEKKRDVIEENKILKEKVAELEQGFNKKNTNDFIKVRDTKKDEYQRNEVNKTKPSPWVNLFVSVTQSSLFKWIYYIAAILFIFTFIDDVFFGKSYWNSKNCKSDENCWIAVIDDLVDTSLDDAYDGVIDGNYRSDVREMIKNLNNIVDSDVRWRVTEYLKNKIINLPNEYRDKILENFDLELSSTEKTLSNVRGYL